MPRMVHIGVLSCCLPDHGSMRGRVLSTLVARDFPYLLAGFPQVNGKDFPVRYHQLTVDDDSADIGGNPAVHQKIGAVKGLEMRLLQVDEDQVGRSAGGECAMTSGQAEGVSASPRWPFPGGGEPERPRDRRG